MINYALGALKPKYDCRDYVLKATATGNLPETYEYFNLPPIKNQETSSTCVAHAAAELVEYHYARQHSDYAFERFSTEFIYGYRPSGYIQGQGMLLRASLKSIKKLGDVTYNTLPGNNEVDVATANVNAKLDDLKTAAKPHVISVYFQCKDENSIKQAIYQSGPVMASMGIFKGDKVDKKGNYYSDESSNWSGAHCVLIVGWTKDKWVLVNSWGTKWGDKGKFYLPLNYEFYEAWGIGDDFVEDSIQKPLSIASIKLVYKILNFFGIFSQREVIENECIREKALLQNSPFLGRFIYHSATGGCNWSSNRHFSTRFFAQKASRHSNL